MNHPLLRRAVALACGTLAVGAISPAVALKTVSVSVQAQVQAPVQIIGADSFCSSWTTGSDPSSGATTLTCNPAAGGGTPPTGCVATVNGAASTTLPSSAGGNVSLAASCSTPSSGVTFAWTRNGAAKTNSASWTDTLPANTSTTTASTTSYQVQACSGSACVTIPQNPLTAIVPAAPASGGGGSGGSGTGAWNGTCPGFSNTRILTENWANPPRLLSSDAGGFGPNDALVVVFTTGSSPTPSTLPKIVAAEYGSTPSLRIAALSSRPCDFDAQPAQWAFGTGYTITVLFAIGTGPNPYQGYVPTLANNTTYYLNIKNAPNPGCASSGSCDMFIDLLKPAGM